MKTQANAPKKSAKTNRARKPATTSQKLKKEAKSVEKRTFLNSIGKVEDLPIDKVVPNPENVKRDYESQAFKDFQSNIAMVGLLSPIIVRQADDQYMIVCGHRRYHACKQLGHPTIRAEVRVLDQTMVGIIALSENINREDPKPMEQAKAIKRLLEIGISDTEEIGAWLGMKKSLVDVRIKLLDLIQPVQDLLEEGKIAITKAMELAKYAEDYQKEIYDKHLKNEDAASWLNISTAEFQKKLYNAYTRALSDYRFDKTMCTACPNNTGAGLFPEFNSESAKCANGSCLLEKNREYLIEQAAGIMKQDNKTILGGMDDVDGEVVLALEKLGFDVLPVYDLDFTVMEKPVAPQRIDFTSDKDWKDAVKVNKSKTKEYQKKILAYEQDRKNGKYQRIALIQDFDVELAYVEVVAEEATSEAVEATNTAIQTTVEATNTAIQTTVEAVEDAEEISNEPISEPQQRVQSMIDNNNLSIQHLRDKMQSIQRDSVIDLTRESEKLMLDHPIAEGGLTPVERQLFHATLFDYITPGNHTALGLESWELSPDEQVQLAESLTEEQFVILAREAVRSFLSGLMVPGSPWLAKAMLYVQELVPEKYQEKVQNMEKRCREQLEKTEAEIVKLQQDNEMYRKMLRTAAVDKRLSAPETGVEPQLLLAEQSSTVCEEPTGAEVESDEYSEEYTPFEEVTDDLPFDPDPVEPESEETGDTDNE